MCENDFIPAIYARYLANEVNNRTVWDKLCEKIKQASSRGEYLCVFNEIEEDCYFSETRKEVKAKLESMGYFVEYSRVPAPECSSNEYHTRYIIRW